MWNEFKQFAFKGNVIDLAIGVVIGGAFGKIVSSLVNNIIMPLLAKILGSEKQFEDLTAFGIQYGAFIQSVFDFFIIAAAIFFFVRTLNKLQFAKKKEEEVKEAPKETTDDVLKEIRDLLRAQAEKDKTE